MDWNAASAIASSISTVLAGVAIVVSARVARRIHDEQLRQGRRQDLIPIWREMFALNRVNSAAPDNEQVRTALNLLSLIATCAEEGVVDESILRDMFADAYCAVYSDVHAISVPVEIGTTTQLGRDFLADSPVIKRWYDKWST